MSSIYDVLQKIQGEKQSWTAPVDPEKEPEKKKRPVAWLIACAVIVSSLCTAGIFLGVRMLTGEKPGTSATAVTATGPDGRPAISRQVPGPHARLDRTALPAPSAASPSAAGPAFAAPPAAAAPPGPMPGDTLENYLKMGDQHFIAKDYDKALLTYTQALHYFGKDVRILNNIGNVYLAQGQPVKAINYFKQSNGISRNFVEPVYNLACAYARLGDKVQAVVNLRKACSMNPEARQWAAADPDLMTLKGNPEFDRVVGAQ